MHWFFFILFMIWTLALIWNGKDLFNKKQWLLAGLMFVLVLVATVRLGIKGHSSPAVHVIFRDYGGAQKIQRRKL